MTFILFKVCQGCLNYRYITDFLRKICHQRLQIVTKNVMSKLYLGLLWVLIGKSKLRRDYKKFLGQY